MSVYARSTFARTDRSTMAQWWWTVDRWTIVAIIALIAFGSLMVMAASPAVAVRIGAESTHFIKRYFLVLPMALALMFSISLTSPRAIRLISFAGLAIGLVLLAYTLFNGIEIKGARRWIDLPGES
ncbi:MAG TPA: FtsW/RodA/SpoVE family cell cycle protein, partial [Stellaceae bacterium]|nr:FtsW/RodA/SpoVE family cell cycle protein [Stellaceae bacterium]